MSTGQRRFKTLGNNLFQVCNRILKNQEVCRLLKYQDQNPFSTDKPDVDGDELLNKNVLIIPKIPDVPESKSFIIIAFSNYEINKANFDFKNTSIRFDIVCPYDSWIINNQSLRPYLLMNEIDNIFNGAKLQGIGTLDFSQSLPLTLSPEIGGYSLYYKINDFN